MGAKRKLNAAHFNGAMIIAGLLGGVTGSWEVFLIAFVALMIGAIVAGDVRR
jgi:hypothetical protein